MVDQANLAEVNRLNTERLTIQQAIDFFDEGGRVINLIIGRKIESEDSEGNVIESEGWPLTTGLINVEKLEYPEQMKAAIIQFLENRIMEIAYELQNLGLTGVEQPRPRSPEPTSDKPKTKSKRRAA